MSRCKVLVFLFLLSLCSFPLQAQFYRSANLSFGRPRIQYGSPQWSFYRTHTADIYYYSKSQPLAIYTASQIDTLIQQVEKNIHFKAKNKLQIIIYSKYSDYKQTNINWESDESYYPSGWTPLSDHKILLYHDGNMRTFQKHLRYGISQWMVNQLLQENSRLIRNEHLPVWFKEGAGAYFAELWDESLFAKVQDGFATGEYKQIFRLPKTAQITAGNSFWRFIALTYGKSKVTPILQIAALTDDYDKAFQSVLLKTWEQLYPEWEKFYRIDTAVRITVSRNGNSDGSDEGNKGSSRHKNIVVSNKNISGNNKNSNSSGEHSDGSNSSDKNDSSDKNGGNKNDDDENDSDKVNGSDDENDSDKVNDVRSDIHSVTSFSPLLQENKALTRYDQFSTSSDGRFTAFSTNKEGQACIYLYDRENNSLKRLSSRHYRVEDYPDYSTPILLWQPQEPILSVIDEKNNKVYLRHYNLSKNRWEKEQVLFVDKVTGAAYSNNGKQLAITALQNSQTDLFLYDIRGRNLNRITNDKADEADPCFVMHDQIIVVSSNRKIHSNSQTATYDPTNNNNPAPNSGQAANSRHTNNNPAPNSGQAANSRHTNNNPAPNSGQPANSRHTNNNPANPNNPASGHPTQNRQTLPNNDTPQTDSYCTGMMDLYAYHIADKKWEQWSFTPNIDERHTLETEGGNILYISNNQMGLNQHCIGYIHTSTDSTGQYHNTLYSRPILTHPSAAISHSYHKESHELLVSYIENGYPVIYKTTLPPIESMPSTSAISSEEHFVSAYPENAGSNKDFTIPIPRILETEYGNLSLTSKISPDLFNIEYQQFTNTSNPIYLNSGINLNLLLTAKDLMEDHRLSIGGRASFNLRNREFLFSYEDITKRWDKQWILYYQSIENKHDANNIIKLQSTSAFFKLGYPIDEANTIHITPYLRYNQKHAVSINDSSLLLPTKKSFWIGLKGDYVADFTKLIGDNIRKGFRGKIFAEALLSPFSEYHFLNVIGFDFRHYQVLRHNLIWANRVAASSSFGRDHLIYFLGGVDRWINASFDATTPIDTSYNYSYQALGTNMRGFAQNIRNGNSFFVWNTEVRFPFISYIFKQKLKSPLLNNMQVVGFADVGTAWHDTHLYHRILNTIQFQNSNKSQFVAGLGIGFRAYALGHCLRLDYAWGLENGKFNKGIFYLSFDSDF